MSLRRAGGGIFFVEPKVSESPRRAVEDTVPKRVTISCGRSKGQLWLDVKTLQLACGLYSCFGCCCCSCCCCCGSCCCGCHSSVSSWERISVSWALVSTCSPSHEAGGICLGLSSSHSPFGCSSVGYVLKCEQGLTPSGRGQYRCSVHSSSTYKSSCCRQLM